jgi:hypothetical protein
VAKLPVGKEFGCPFSFLLQAAKQLIGTRTVKHPIKAGHIVCGYGHLSKVKDPFKSVPAVHAMDGFYQLPFNNVVIILAYLLQ